MTVTPTRQNELTPSIDLMYSFELMRIECIHRTNLSDLFVLNDQIGVLQLRQMSQLLTAQYIVCRMKPYQTGNIGYESDV
jgi:hypothetical protein